MSNLRVYPTHIEVQPYKSGQLPSLEKICSSDWDSVRHRRDPIGYHIDDKTDTLYIPRGVNVNYLSEVFQTVPTFYKKPYTVKKMKGVYHIIKPPRDKVEEESIKFLLSEDRFIAGKNYSQLTLNLKPGFGKTYCAVCAAVAYRERTLIIVHQSNLLSQWEERILEYTDIPKERIYTLSTETAGANKQLEKLKESDDIDFDIMIVMHPSLTAYAKKHGDDAFRELINGFGFGLKIIDEAHLCFKQLVRLDFFSDVPRNFYLTATLSRSDKKEVRVFNLVFSNTPRFGDKAGSYKNFIYNLMFFNSRPSPEYEIFIKTGYGVSNYKYSEYAFKRDPKYCLLDSFLYVMDQAVQHEGKILVIASKISDCEFLKKVIEKEYNGYEVGTIHSKNTNENNKWVKENADIIVSRFGSLGTGVDIQGIRSLVILDPYSSKVTANQLTGRLRPYKDKDSYVYHLVDSGFDSLMRQVRTLEPTLKAISKKVVKTNI